MCGCEPVNDSRLGRIKVTGPSRRKKVHEWNVLSDMKITSFFHNLWLGLCKVYLETIFPPCRNDKNKKPRLIGHWLHAQRELLCVVLLNPQAAGLKLQ